MVHFFSGRCRVGVGLVTIVTPPVSATVKTYICTVKTINGGSTVDDETKVSKQLYSLIWTEQDPIIRLKHEETVRPFFVFSTLTMVRY